MKSKKNKEPEELSPRLKQLQAELLEHRSRKPEKEQAEKRHQESKIWLFLIALGLISLTLLLLFIFFGDDALDDKPNDLYKVILFSSLLVLAPALLISFINIRRLGLNIREDKKRISRSKGLIVSNDVHSSWGDSQEIYRPEISYQYDVNNYTFTGTHRLWRHWHSSFKKANKALANYLTGTVVRVYYDPNDIQNSAIKRTSRIKHLFMIFVYVFACIFLSAGTYLFLRFAFF